MTAALDTAVESALVTVVVVEAVCTARFNAVVFVPAATTTVEERSVGTETLLPDKVFVTALTTAPATATASVPLLLAATVTTALAIAVA